MSSLRVRIFTLVAAVTLVVWASAATWTYVNTRSEIQRVLDRRLVEAARMVASLSGDLSQGSAPAADAPNQFRTNSYSRQLSCQIWSLDGELIGRSSQAPAEPLAVSGTGFSQREINGETWRVYSLADETKRIRVLVGDNLSVRQGLIADLMTGLLVPFVAAIVALALLIWAAVGAGLTPLREVARRLRQRDPSDFQPLGVARTSSELQPVVGAIDSLFERLALLRENERHFIASAAHELQTPLAGLRTHAQIALMAKDAETRDKSLRRIQTSVDRTSRLVHQLLDLAREEALLEQAPSSWVRVGGVTAALTDELAVQLERAEVEIRCTEAASDAEILIDEGSFAISLRNLLDNAISHSPQGGVIEVAFHCTDQTASVSVIDAGPGIPDGELGHVRNRFVRGTRAKGHGSGLGLSIVELVMARAGAQLQLSNRENRNGLSASLIFPPDRARLRSVQSEARTDDALSST